MTVRFIVNIDVPALAPAISFYSQAFGLTTGRALGDSVMEMLGGPTPLYLLQKAQGSSAAPQGTPALRTYGRHWTPVHLDWIVDDIHAALQRVLQAGALLEQDIRRADWGQIALVADPFGHGHCLIEFSQQGYDALAGCC